MAIVRVEPDGFEIDVNEGEPLAIAAWRLGYDWPTRCWGQAECMACFVQVLSGEAESDVEPAGDHELSRMRLLMSARVRGPRTRLACQLQVRRGGLVVEKKGIRPPEPVGSVPDPRGAGCETDDELTEHERRGPQGSLPPVGRGE